MKIIGTDGVAVGNRDNQIQGAAIVPQRRRKRQPQRTPRHLARPRRTRPLRARRQRNSNADPDANGYGYANSNADGYGNANSNADGYSNADPDADGHGHTNSNADGHGHAEPDTNGYGTPTRRQPTHASPTPTDTATSTPTATDTSTPTPTNTPFFGCTPGFWKNHPGDWPAPYSPNQTLASVFGPIGYGLDSDSLITALNYPGGNGQRGAAQILMRAGVAALLNAADPDIDYDTTLYDTPPEVISAIQAALASGDRATMINLASVLDGWNNGVCIT